MRIFILKNKKDFKRKFTLIYKHNYWSSKFSKSGDGCLLKKPKM